MAPTFLGLLNRLLPFATPNTPLLQDLLHLTALCLLLYFAPQIQQTLQTRNDSPPEQRPNAAGEAAEGILHEPVQEPTNLEHAAINEPEANRELEEERPDGLQPELNAAIEGRPDPAHAPNTTANRNVGAKKAKSLARRDQRRAYHEFMRSQGEMQRAREAEGAPEREAALAAEKERRRAAKAAFDAKEAKERESRKDEEERERMEEFHRRELAVRITREQLAARNTCDLFDVVEKVGGDVDDRWVEQILNAAGMIGRKGDTLTMITSMGWVVRVTEKQMASLYISAANNGMGNDHGRIENEELGAVLETMLRV